MSTIESSSPTNLVWNEKIFNKMYESTAGQFLDGKIEVIPNGEGTHNRFKDILCVKKTAIAFEFEGNKQNRYLHANQLDLSAWGISLDRMNIVAAQAPTDHEILNVWLKVAKCGYTILNLTTRKDNVNPYAPSLDKPMLFEPHFEIKATTELQEQNSLKIQEFDVNNLALEENIGHVKSMQYSYWPDHGIISLDRLINLVDAIEKEGKNKLWVHCRGGMERTGTIVTSLFLKRLIQDETIGSDNYDFAFANLVVYLRMQRSEMFMQNPEQCKLAYEFGVHCLRTTSKSETIL